MNPPPKCSNCKHKGWRKGNHYFTGYPTCGKKDKNLPHRTIAKGGKIVSVIDKTPLWCPLRKG